MSKPKPHISDYKKKEADRIKTLLQKYKIIAVADMTGMPSPQLQRLRANTKSNFLITMSKGRVIKVVIDELKGKIKGIEKLSEYIKGMPALLLTNDNPFKLAKKLKKSKSSAPARAGQIAPNDIIIPAGPTPFPPGPIIGELGIIGVKSSVVDGKVTVKEDTVVVKEGQEIKPEVANILTRLGIEPMEIGINLLAALEEGVVFEKRILAVDEEEYIKNIKLGSQSAFNLAFYIAFPTNSNIRLLIQKAFRESEALADSQNILTSSNVKKVVGKAGLEAEVLKSKLNLPDAQVSEESKQDNPRVEVKPKIYKDESQQKVGEMSEMEKEEQAAQKVLRRLQDEKLGKRTNEKEDAQFRENEKVAKDLLRKMQDEKIKKGGK